MNSCLSKFEVCWIFEHVDQTGINAIVIPGLHVFLIYPEECNLKATKAEYYFPKSLQSQIFLFSKTYQMIFPPLVSFIDIPNGYIDNIGHQYKVL